MLGTHGCFSDQNPQLAWAVSVPHDLGKEVEQAAHAAWRQRSRSPLFLCPCLPRAGLAMIGCWWRMRRLKRDSVQFSLSVRSDSVTPWTAVRQASVSVPNSQSLLKCVSIELVMPSNNLILCHPLLFLPSILPSSRVFSNDSVLHIG